METIERTFNVIGAARLNLANISGSVDIQPGVDGVVSVSAVKHTNGDAEHTQIEIDQGADGSVNVKTDYQESVWRLFGQRPCDVDYTVRVPHDSAIVLRCVSSSGAVRGVNGELTLSTVSGGLDLADLSGSLRLNGVSGRIWGERLAGQMKVETVSGDVKLRDSQLSTLNVSTVSGNITLETSAALANDPHHVHSVSGEVHLIVPAQTRCTVEGSSLSGRIKSDIPVTRSQHSGQRWHMELQGGGPLIRFDSISGNLVIKRDQRDHAQVAAQPEPALAATEAELPSSTKDVTTEGNVQGIPPKPIEDAEQARRDILDRIARGELSVDEAVNLLRG
jgi:hypothetical protein